ncbi:unnamed protein product [Symbiodinium sp. CCMP2592]|nr:unnamed protein product [Symbiodinium sp. CCMP2592]
MERSLNAVRCLLVTCCVAFLLFLVGFVLVGLPVAFLFPACGDQLVASPDIALLPPNQTLTCKSMNVSSFGEAVVKQLQDPPPEAAQACGEIIDTDVVENKTVAQTCLEFCHQRLGTTFRIMYLGMVVSKAPDLNTSAAEERKATSACLKAEVGFRARDIAWLLAFAALMYRLLGILFAMGTYMSSASGDSTALCVAPDSEICRDDGPFANGNVGLPWRYCYEARSDFEASRFKLLVSLFGILTEPFFDVVSLASYLRHGQPFYFVVASLGLVGSAASTGDPLQADCLVEWYRSYSRGFKTRGLLRAQAGDVTEVMCSTAVQLYAALVMTTEPTQVLMLLFFAVLSLGFTLPEIWEGRWLLRDPKLKACNFDNFYEMEAARHRVGKAWKWFHSFLAVAFVELWILLCSARWGLLVHQFWHFRESPGYLPVVLGLPLLLSLSYAFLLLLRFCCRSPRPGFIAVYLFVLVAESSVVPAPLTSLLCMDVLFAGGRSPFAEYYFRTFHWEWQLLLWMLCWFLTLGLSESCLCALAWASLSRLGTSLPWKLGVTTAGGICVAALWAYLLQDFDWQQSLTALAAFAQVLFHGGALLVVHLGSWWMAYSFLFEEPGSQPRSAETAEEGGGTDTEAPLTSAQPLLHADSVAPSDGPSWSAADAATSFLDSIPELECALPGMPQRPSTRRRGGAEIFHSHAACRPMSA